MSDGSIGIEELILLAKRRNLCAVAVTDHDTTAGATRAMIIGKRMGVNVIHGVEFSSFDEGRQQKAHILCYDCQKPDRLEGICHRTNDSRKRATLEAIRKVMRYYPVPSELFVRCAAGSTSLHRHHIMHALLEAGYVSAIHGEEYHRLFDPENGIAYVKQDWYPDPKAVIDLIHSAGGVAVLAHPYLYHNDEALMEELTAYGLDGVEVYRPEHGEEKTAALKAFADEHGLLATGGSDFHGMYAGEAHPIGIPEVDEAMVQAILSRKRLTDE